MIDINIVLELLRTTMINMMTPRNANIAE